MRRMALAQGAATQVGSAVTLPVAPTWRPVSVSMDSTGNFAIAWTGAGTTGNGLDIFAQRYLANGTLDGSQILVLNTPPSRTGDQVAPAVALDGLNDLVVAWQDLSGKDTSGYGIYAQRFRGTNRTGGISVVNTFVSGNQRHPAVELDASGNFVIVWESPNQDGNGYGIYGRRGSVGSITFSTNEFPMNTLTAGDQTLPTVSINGAGQCVVTWQGPDDDATGIFARQFDSSGVAVGSEFLVNTTTTGAQTDPTVALDTDGNFAILWTSVGQDGAGTSLQGQRFSTLGTRRGADFQANLQWSGDQSHPRVAIVADNSLVTTWDGNGAGDTSGVLRAIQCYLSNSIGWRHRECWRFDDHRHHYLQQPIRRRGWRSE